MGPRWQRDTGGCGAGWSWLLGQLRARWATGEGERAPAQMRRREGAALAGPRLLAGPRPRGGEGEPVGPLGKKKGEGPKEKKNRPSGRV